MYIAFLHASLCLYFIKFLKGPAMAERLVPALELASSAKALSCLVPNLLLALGGMMAAAV